jgi:hypothetical protein
VEYEKRDANLRFEEEKKMNKIKKLEKSKTLMGRMRRRFEKFKKRYSKKYIHDKQY